jgi:formate-dependent phosphoribosylglycinamide formyltransferase (GAR transformylase)
MNVLILGCGSAQVDAMRYLKKAGNNVHALSYKDEGPGRNYADHFCVIDIVDKDQVLAYVLKNRIELVYSIGSDVALPTISRVSELMDLPYFVNENTVMTMVNKGAFRVFLYEHRINNVDFTLCRSADDLVGWSQFPAVVKPVDSQGQRGVLMVSCKQDLEKAFKRSLFFSRSKAVIVETYIEGHEISVNAFIYKTAIKYAFVSDRVAVKGVPGGLPESHSIPSRLPEDKQLQAIFLVQQTTQALGIRNGPVYFQLKVNPKGIFIIEATPRLDGCHLWRLIHFTYGIDLLDLTFKLLLNVDAIRFEKPRLPPAPKTLKFFFAKPGTLFSKESLTTEDNDFVTLYYKEGEEIRTVNGFLEKTGYQIVEGAG